MLRNRAATLKFKSLDGVVWPLALVDSGGKSGGSFEIQRPPGVETGRPLLRWSPRFRDRQWGESGLSWQLDRLAATSRISGTIRPIIVIRTYILDESAYFPMIRVSA